MYRRAALVLKLLVPQRDGTYEVSLRYATNVYRRRISLLSADEDIVRAFCEKGLRTYNNRYLGPTTCETVWFLPRTYEKKIKDLHVV